MYNGFLSSGRKGLNIRQIRVMTNTIINSPKIKDNKSSHCFRVEAQNELNLAQAILILYRMGDYFKMKILERLQISDGFIRHDYVVPNQMVSDITFCRGRFLVDLRSYFDVNIISPKPYSDECAFIVIGPPVS